MQSLLEGAQEWHSSARCHQQITGTWVKFRVYCGYCHVGLLPYFHVINDTNQPTGSLPAYTYVYIIIYHDLCSALDLHVHGVLFIPGLLYLYVWCINDCLIAWLLDCLIMIDILQSGWRKQQIRSIYNTRASSWGLCPCVRNHNWLLLASCSY